MTHHRITFRTEALEQLEEIYDYIAAAGSPGNAAGFTESIISFCEGLADFPYRGMARDDLRPGLRTIGYKKSTIIAYATLNHRVTIVGIFYGGRDYEYLLVASE